jgi:hypothetical protein
MWFRVSGFGFRVPGSGYRSFGFRVSGFGFRGQDFGVRVSGFRVEGLGTGLVVRENRVEKCVERLERPYGRQYACGIGGLLRIR